MFTSETRVTALEGAINTVNTQLQNGLGESSFQLRIATPDDIAQCKQIHADVKEKDHINLGDDSVYEDAMTKGDNGALIVAVTPDGKVIGVSCFEYSSSRRWELNVISSLPSSRQEGPVGSALMCATMATLQNLNVKSVSLTAAIEILNPKTKERTFNEKLFNWYQQQFKFDIEDYIVNAILKEGKNIKDIIKEEHGLTVIEMACDKLQELKLTSVLEKAISKKNLKNAPTATLQVSNATSNTPDRVPAPLFQGPKTSSTSYVTPSVTNNLSKKPTTTDTPNVSHEKKSSKLKKITNFLRPGKK